MTGTGLTVIVTNARIGTSDPMRPWATALGIREGLLAVVGSAAEILKMASAGTQIIDAGRQLLTLPVGSTAGTPVTVAIGTDGRVTIHSTGDGS